jgi:hypothetical protein
MRASALALIPADSTGTDFAHGRRARATPPSAPFRLCASLR